MSSQQLAFDKRQIVHFVIYILQSYLRTSKNTRARLHFDIVQFPYVLFLLVHQNKKVIYLIVHIYDCSYIVVT